MDFTLLNYRADNNNMCTCLMKNSSSVTEAALYDNKVTVSLNADDIRYVLSVWSPNQNTPGNYSIIESIFISLFTEMIIIKEKERERETVRERETGRERE